MKNIIIAAQATYIYYSFCVVKNLLVTFVMFFIILGLVLETEELLKDFLRWIKGGKYGA